MMKIELVISSTLGIFLILSRACLLWSFNAGFAITLELQPVVLPLEVILEHPVFLANIEDQCDPDIRLHISC